MDDCPRYSCYNFAWQATMEGILSNLQGALQNASNTNASGYLPTPKKLTTEARIMLIIILIFVFLTVIGSSVNAIERFCKEFGKKISYLIIKANVKAGKGAELAGTKNKLVEPSVYADVWKNCKKYLGCFSVQSNCKTIFSTVSGEEQVNALRGIKTLALVWVAMCHICLFDVSRLRTVTEEFQNIIKGPIIQSLLGMVGTDSVFTMSGFISAYMFFDNKRIRKGKKSVFKFYIRKFLRFTPFYLIVLGFYATLFSYTDSGPVWPAYDTNPICRENWIWNVLYLNNFLTHKKQCLITTWHIACELQLHIVSPLFLLLLMRRPKIGFALIAACICGSNFTTFILTKRFNLIDCCSKYAAYAQDLDAFYLQFWMYYDTIYVKPYTKMDSYLLGILLGYYIIQRKFREDKRNSLKTLSIGWLVTIIFLFIAFTGIYNGDELSWQRAVYGAVKRFLVSCSLSWIVFVCVTGQGGFINRFFSHKIFGPFSRLLYSFYFIHIIVIERYFLSVEDLVDFSPMSMLSLALYLLLCAWTVSFVVSLIFERPLLNLIDILLKDTKQEKKVQ